MIHFDKQPEPDAFDQDVRTPGNAWVVNNPRAGRPLGRTRPPAIWNECKPALQKAFRDLCAYSVMYDANGTVDHYISCDTDEAQAYEWDNYRLASSWINSAKQNADDSVLDPFEVQDDWFEMHLPSCQLKVSGSCPAAHRAKAEHTLKRLHLDHDERVVRQRAEWYRMYKDGEITLDGLRKKAPLIARAIDAQKP